MANPWNTYHIIVTTKRWGEIGFGCLEMMFDSVVAKSSKDAKEIASEITTLYFATSKDEITSVKIERIFAH